MQPIHEGLGPAIGDHVRYLRPGEQHVHGQADRAQGGLAEVHLGPIQPVGLYLRDAIALGHAECLEIVGQARGSSAQRKLCATTPNTMAGSSTWHALADRSSIQNRFEDTANGHLEDRGRRLAATLVQPPAAAVTDQGGDRGEVGLEDHHLVGTDEAGDDGVDRYKVREDCGAGVA